MSDIKFEIIEEIGILATYGSKQKILALVSWNDAEPKYDIRTWDLERTQPGKGVTLDDDEILVLKKAIQSITF